MVSGVRHLGRERHERAADAERGEQLHAARVEVAELGRIVGALAQRVDERALDVHADHAGHARLDGRAHRARSRAAITERSSLMSVGRNPVVPKRRCAAPMARIASTLGIVVEEHAAAAVHLAVDEPGRRQAPSQVAALGLHDARIVLGHDRGDALAFDEHGRDPTTNPSSSRTRALTSARIKWSR